jgi:hypothetical protein
MTYTAQKPPLPETPEQLRARIPGWGSDLDPADRPSVPREKLDNPEFAGARWELPEQQPETFPREMSIEHARLTPVFGTTCPPSGVSGAIRRKAYENYSEARAAHWLLLVAADRVDALGSTVRSFATLRPDNPITQTGVLSEFRRGGVRSRREGRRVDLPHQLLDPVVVGAPWVLGGVAVLAAVRRLRRWSA